MAPVSALPGLVDNTAGRGGDASTAYGPPSDLTLSNTPRHVVIRSRVLMQRTAAGTRGIPLPQELLPAAGRIETDNNGEASTARGKCNRATQFIGEGTHQVPVELVAAFSSRAGPSSVETKPRKVVPLPAPGQESAKENSKDDISRSRQYQTPNITPELRADLKQRLDGLQSVARADFKAHPRSTRFFVRELWEVCQLLKLPTTTRGYRRHMGSHLYHFVMNFPDLLPADMAPSSAELADDCMVALTIMLSLDIIDWQFKFNGTTYRMCNCPSNFGSPNCVCPASGNRSSEIQPAAPAGARSSPRPPGRQRNHAPIGEAQAGVPREKHFPTRLLDVSTALRGRVREFASQVPNFLEDLLSIPDSTSSRQKRRMLQAWERWTSHIVSEIGVLDRYYTQFERLYMGIVQNVIETNLEPIRSMTGPSDSLASGSPDSFREVNTTVFCQRLGILKQMVDFGGKYQLLNFDSGLLEKARRVLLMETHASIQQMASRLLHNFNALCKVLVSLNDDQIKPELRDNPELREAVLALEDVWAYCQYLLSQGSLDFIQVLLKILPGLDPQLKWQMRIALLSSHSETCKLSPPDVDPDEVVAARVALYQTVPMVVYVDELWEDVSPHPGGTSPKREGPRFMELCCPKDDRHQALRRDLAKFDLKRYQEFRKFLMSEEERIERENDRTADFFRLVFKQVKALSAFPVQECPAFTMQAASTCEAARKRANNEELDEWDLIEQEMLEGAARWVCLIQQAQAVAPHLFPTKSPVQELQEVKPRASFLGGKRPSRSSIVNTEAMTADTVK